MIAGLFYLDCYLPIDIRVRSSLKLLLPADSITDFDMSCSCLLEFVLKFSSITFKEPSIPISSPDLSTLSDNPSVKAINLLF